MRMHRELSLLKISIRSLGREDYINPTIDGELSWRSVKSYDMDSEDAMERWKISYMRSPQGGVHISL
jgi:hypothetical protein